MKKRTCDFLEDLFVPPDSEHPSDEELLNCSLERLIAEDLDRIETHLRRCSRCANALAILHEAAEFYSSREGKERLEGLQRQLKCWISQESHLSRVTGTEGFTELLGTIATQLTESWRSAFGRGLLAAATKSTTLEGYDESGQIYWCASWEPNGDLNVIVSSNNSAFAGCRFRIVFTELPPPEVVLHSVPAGHVLGEVRIDKSMLPEDISRCRLELMPADRSV